MTKEELTKKKGIKTVKTQTAGESILTTQQRTPVLNASSDLFPIEEKTNKAGRPKGKPHTKISLKYIGIQKTSLSLAKSSTTVDFPIRFAPSTIKQYKTLSFVPHFVFVKNTPFPHFVLLYNTYLYRQEYFIKKSVQIGRIFF